MFKYYYNDKYIQEGLSRSLSIPNSHRLLIEQGFKQCKQAIQFQSQSFLRDQTSNIIKCNVLLQNRMIEFIICCTLTKYNNMSKCEVESFIFSSAEHLSSFVSQNNDLVRQCLLHSVLGGFISL